MATITHPKAQYLLQAATDSILTPQDETCLKDHLSECEECRQYAKRLGKLQDDLRRATRYRWDRVSIQLSAKEIKNRSAKVNAQAYNLQTLGKFSIAIVVLVIVFILAINVSSTMKDIPASINDMSLTPEKQALTPTPVIKETVTNSTVQECNEIAYSVQENDTLESIAARYSVSKEIIKARNGLAANTLTVNMILVIPSCEGTPTNSTMTPTMTTTSTP